jgi:hypothetical protein
LLVLFPQDQCKADTLSGLHILKTDISLAIGPKIAVRQGDLKGGDTTLDEAENYPSLINCLETGENGLALDLDLPSRGQDR